MGAPGLEKESCYMSKSTTELPVSQTALSVGAPVAAAMVGLSLRTWWRLQSIGKAPKGVRVGGRKLWRVSDLQRWVDDGFPDVGDAEGGRP